MPPVRHGTAVLLSPVAFLLDLDLVLDRQEP